MKLSISEIVKGAQALTTKTDKIAFLQKHDSQPLQLILRLIYDKEIEFLLPDTPPPWNKNQLEDEAKTMLYREARRMKIFIKGGGYDQLKPVKREALFISLLEDIDNDDADIIAHNVLLHKPLKGLTLKTLLEAYPNFMETKIIQGS